MAMTRIVRNPSFKELIEGVFKKWADHFFAISTEPPKPAFRIRSGRAPIMSQGELDKVLEDSLQGVLVKSCFDCVLWEISGGHRLQDGSLEWIGVCAHRRDLVSQQQLKDPWYDPDLHPMITGANYVCDLWNKDTDPDRRKKQAYAVYPLIRPWEYQK